jgi:hypothetical protein
MRSLTLLLLVLLAAVPARAQQSTISTGSGQPTVSAVIAYAAAANAVQVKAGPGNFYGAYVTTGGTAGYLMAVDTATAPSAGGSAVTPFECIYAPATQTTSINYLPGPPAAFVNGLYVLFSTTGCSTNTAGATAAFLHGTAK